jgi:hypothetical protein
MTVGAGSARAVEAGVVAVHLDPLLGQMSQELALELLPGALAPLAAGHGILVSQQVDGPAALAGAEQGLERPRREVDPGERSAPGPATARGRCEESPPTLDEEGAGGRCVVAVAEGAKVGVTHGYMGVGRRDLGAASDAAYLGQVHRGLDGPAARWEARGCGASGPSEMGDAQFSAPPPGP